MPNRKEKRKGITTNHQDCINQMNTLYTKLEETEGDYNNLLLQNNTLKCIVDKQTTEISELIKTNKQLSQDMDNLVIKQNSKPVDIKNSNDYINLKKDNENMLKKNKEIQNQLDILNSKLNNLDNKELNECISSDIESQIEEALDRQKVNFDNDFNSYKKEQEKRYNILNDNFIKLQNKKANPATPTPSSSTENKFKLSLPDNFYEIVYYRRNNMDKFNSYYFKKDNIYYLSCCDQKYEKEISYNNKVTCNKCYKTYHLSEDIDKNSSLYDIICEILPEHIIIDEEDIFNKIKCNMCNCVSKKEIKMCRGCVKQEQGRNFIANYKVFNEPDKNKIGYKCKLLAAEETYIKLVYLDNLFITARNDGVDITDLKELVEYIKENKLIEEKQNGIIKNKILRSSSIISLFNDDKYINIQDYIKRINFKIKDLSKLSRDQWNSFRVFIEKELNEQLNHINNEDKKQYNCKNTEQECDETTTTEDTFCDLCIKNMKICKDCKIEFINDEIDVIYCSDCIVSDSDDE
jgi:hypothetical protein